MSLGKYVFTNINFQQNVCLRKFDYVWRAKVGAFEINNKLISNLFYAPEIRTQSIIWFVQATVLGLLIINNSCYQWNCDYYVALHDPITPLYTNRIIDWDQADQDRDEFPVGKDLTYEIDWDTWTTVELLDNFHHFPSNSLQGIEGRSRFTHRDRL